jgi:hypothetical protein
MKWKVKTSLGKLVHLYELGADKTLCGKPQENYDTEEGLYTLEKFKYDYHLSGCKKCIQIASLHS